LKITVGVNILLMTEDRSDTQ